MPAYGELRKFYNSASWRKLRKAYYTAKGGICEECGAVCLKGEFNIHHKITLTEKNCKNPNIALNAEHLKLLCVDCHNQEEGRFLKKKQKIFFNERGEVEWK